MTRRAILAFCVVTTCVLAEPATQQQWLKNPTMALQKGKPTGWRFHGFGTGGKAIVSERGGRQGSAAVGVRAEAPKQRGAWLQRVSIGKHRFVKVQGWYRTEGLKPAKGRGATVRMSYRGAKGVFHGDHRHYLEPSEEWQRFELTDRVLGSDGTVEVELFNFFVPGTVWFDDVTCGPGRAEDWAAKVRDRMDRPPAASQVGYAPKDGETIRFTPPAFRWVPVGAVKEYRVQWSRSAEFPAAATEERRSSICIYTPHVTLSPGEWHWRYGFAVEGTEVVAWSRPRRFSIADDPMDFPRPRPEEIAAQIPKSRPRVYFTPELLSRVREGKEPGLKAMVERVARSAKSRLGQEVYPEPPRLPKDRTERRNKYQEIFRTMRPWTSGMETCALAYVLTGDRRFGDEAKRRLLHYASWDPRGSTSVFHNDEPAMDLAMRGPRTFDWICDLLSEAERKKCIEAWRVRLGEINRLHRRMPFESRPFSSHPGRMVPFMVEGSIAFYHEVPEARDWLEYTLHLMWNTYPAWGSADGGWHEGPGYWGAYIGMMTRNVYGFGAVGKQWKRKPFFQNTGYFGLYAVPAYARQKPFGDGHGGSVGRGQASILYGLASFHDNPYFRWYAEVQGVRSMYGPEAFMSYRPDLAPKPPVDVPQARVFDNIGVVGMHSNLADPVGSVQMLFKSDPYGSVSHNHASQNAFAINAFGEALAISSGYYQQYGCPHHAQWTWETKAHNSITIDGKGQRKRSRESRGRIARFWEDGNITYTMGDATDAYEGRLKRFHRHVVFLRPDTFVMVDDIEASQPVSAEWWLHARSEMQVNEEQRMVTTAQGNARLATQFLAPESVTFGQTDQFPVAPHRPNSANQWHLTVTPAERSARPQFLTVMRAYRDREEGKPFRARTLKAEGFLCAQVRGPNTLDLVAIRQGHVEGDKRGEGVMIARWSRDGKTLRGYFGFDARAVELEPGVVIQSDKRVSASAQFGTREARVVIEAAEDAECSVHVPRRYRDPVEAKGVLLAARDGDTAELEVAPGRHVLVFPLAKGEPVAPVELHTPAKTVMQMKPTVGSHATAWLASTDGMPDGLHDAAVNYWAPTGSRLVLTAGRHRHEWVAPGGDAEERFRWVMMPGEFPLVLIDEHGLDRRARVRSIQLNEIKATGKLRETKINAAMPGSLKIEAERFESHVGPPESTRSGKYVCSGGLLYGMGDMVTRVDYGVTAPKAGTYSIAFKHASDRPMIAISLELNGKCPDPAAELMLFDRTGGWGYNEKQWRVQRLCDANGRPVAISLNAGKNRLTLRGHGGRMHLDWVALEPR